MLQISLADNLKGHEIEFKYLDENLPLSEGKCGTEASSPSHFYENWQLFMKKNKR
jgi:hypothetical protein